MKAMYEKTASVAASGMPLVADIERAAEAKWHTPQSRQRSEQRIAFQPSGMLLSPGAALIWLLGLLGVAGCIAPWVAHGWLWLELLASVVALVACYDAFVLWMARDRLVPVLLGQEKGLRGREGQSLAIPLALAGTYRSRTPGEIRVAIMPATPESETALRVKSDPQHLKLERPERVEQRSTSAGAAPVQLWPWTPEIALLRRGLWLGPRVGIERRSRLGIWRLRRWFDLPVPLRIDADLRPGRRELLRSPIYRALVAARETPWTGHGRDFERLREYQRGDNFSEIAWKCTARRGTPVTRLFQWEQKQEVYFVVDQSRTSALAIDPGWESEANPQRARAPRRLLDLGLRRLWWARAWRWNWATNLA
jgi:hypothetical protein